MMKKEQLSYLAIQARDEDWGIVVTTVGYQFISPGSAYPLSRHPGRYNFSPLDRRTLNEYQLIYITKGAGCFISQSAGQQKVCEGMAMLLFPGEWHSYYPDFDTGWDEYWVGFRGPYIDRWIENHFFTRDCPLLRVGHSASILRLYEGILDMARKEKTGCQQMISGMVLHMLGAVYCKWKNSLFRDSCIENKILEARQIIADSLEGTFSQEDVAAKLGMGYSWFRRMFKEYTGVPPAQYRLQQKLLRAKELLTGTSMNISEVAYKLHFENVSQFSTFFRKKTGLTPSRFREEYFTKHNY